MRRATFYCNQSAVDLWGEPPILGKDRWYDLAAFRHADGTPMAQADCPTEIALKQGRIVRGVEAIIERKDGSRVRIIPYPTPLYDEKGAIAGVINMTVDISERKKAELALAERNVQFALAAKTALVGSHAYDVDTDSMQVDEGYAALHGLPEGTAETTRSEFRVRTHPEDIDRLEATEAKLSSSSGASTASSIASSDPAAKYGGSSRAVSFLTVGRGARAGWLA